MRLRVLGSLGIILVLILSQISVVGDWPRFGYDFQHTGYTLEPAPDVCNLVWYYTTGAKVLSSPAVVNGVLYIASTDNYVYAINAYNGSLIWKYNTGVNSWIYSSPAFYNDTIYIATYARSNGDEIIALDANDGSLKWNCSDTGDYIMSSPLVVNNVLYIGSSDDNLYCLNASTGEIIWNFTAGGSISSSPAIYDNTIYVGAGDKKVYAVDAQNGVEKWNFTTAKYPWRSAAIAYGTVYIGDSDGFFYAIDASTGIQVWNYSITSPGAWIHSDPAIVDHMVIFGCHDGYLYNLNATNGDLIWKYYAGGTVQGHPAVSDNKVFIGSTNDTFHCVSLDTGSGIWNYTANDNIVTSPAIADGYVYFGSHDSNVYCFGPAGANLPPYPATPTSPSFDIWTNDNTPLFEWQHSDPIDDGQGGFHIQIDNNNNFQSVEYEFNNTSEANSYWQFPDGSIYSTISDGTWYWRIKTMDNKSAWGNWGDCWIINIDTVKPTSNVLQFIPQNYKTPPIPVNCTGSDERSGLQSIELFYRYSVDNQSGWTSWQSFGTDFNEPWYWDFTATNGEGYYEFYSRGQDNSSNVEDAPLVADAMCTSLIPPKVDSTEPLNNSIDMRTFIHVKVTFNEAMDKPSAEAALILSYNAPSYSASWDQNTLILTFDEPLFYNSSFFLKINSDIACDLSGNLLDGNGNEEAESSPFDDYYFQFSTIEKPPVNGWPTFQQNMLRTGFTNATGRITSVQRRWSYIAREAIYSSPIVADINDDGKVEIVCGDYGSPSHIFALYGHNGTLLWEYQVGNPVEGTPAVGDVNGDGDVDVVAGSNDNRVYALNGNNGSLIWKKTLPDNAVNPAIADIDNDTVAEVVIGCSDDTLYVLNGINGTIEWSRSFTAGVLCTPAILDLDHDGELEILIIDGGEIIALNGNNTVVWQLPTTGKESPAVGDVDNDGVLEFVYSTGTGVSCRNVETGSYEWGRGAPDDVQSSPAIGDLDGDGYMEVVFGCDNGFTYAWDGRDGSEHWKYDHGGFVNAIRGSPGIADIDGDGELEVVIGTFNSRIYALNGKDGSMLWREGVGDTVWSSPAIVDINGDRWVEIVIGCSNKRIYALEATEEFIPPRIFSTSPYDNEINVNVNTNLIIRFSEAMNQTSVEQAITITPDHPISNFNWISSNLTITLSSPLSFDTQYIISIDSTIARDISGNYLDGNGNGYSEGGPADDYVWSFWTGTQSIFLYHGWNLISIPSIQTDANIDSVLSSIDGFYDAVQWHNISDVSDPWKHFQSTKPPYLNDLDIIGHTMGFWIHITESSGVLFDCPGIQPTSNQSIALHPGWNMVGYPSLTNRNRTAALNNITFELEVDAIWTFDASTQKWKEIGPSDYFELGRGYWIHATQECVWEVPF